MKELTAEFFEEIYPLNLSESEVILKIMENDKEYFKKYKDYINNEKIAIAGLSLGGPVSIAVSNLAPNVSSTIAASGVISQYKTAGSGITPGMLKYFDQPDQTASLSPKPLYLSWGLNEKAGFGYEANNQYSAKIINNSYKVLDAEEKLVIVIHDEEFNYGHTFELTSIIDFLDNTIG